MSVISSIEHESHSKLGQLINHIKFFLLSLFLYKSKTIFKKRKYTTNFQLSL